ncbi:M20/M25/M40 family metallo-hydrolase [Methanotorris igneus]|uniref:Peptidase dimerization domain protein n=1 Tax=Methanotorris igneus (strain DSM 5666 / JCM 11834 / Kol 5) TaxID=880724 RepID=F6BE88_METIK|nr:M20/M25/M40 family metallo-hydrolase [Methanotorris igneus]AEF96765.1 peptidase dimerization domain protein [Methanotorris igneus Kol 5]
MTPKEFNPIELWEDLSKIRTDNEEGVKKAFKYLSNFFDNLGIKNRIIKGCFVAYRDFEDLQNGVLLNSHIDTVKVLREFEKDDENFYGTGVCDAKAPLVSLVHAFLNNENAVLVVSPDEERDSCGIYNFCHWLKENTKTKKFYCIVGEPTDLKVCIGHKGRFEVVVKAYGKSGHASDPNNGINAIEIIVDVICDLRNFPCSFIEVNGKKYYSSITPTMIKGGIQPNIIPNRAEVILDVRSVEENLMEKIKDYLKEKRYSKYVEVYLNKRKVPYADFYILKNEELLNSISKDFEIDFFNATCEAFYFGNILNADVLIFGAGSLDVIHSPNEFLSIKEFEKGLKMADDLLNRILDFK